LGMITVSWYNLETEPYSRVIVLLTLRLHRFESSSESANMLKEPPRRTQFLRTSGMNTCSMPSQCSSPSYSWT
jgi:hypothetical protein